MAMQFADLQLDALLENRFRPAVEQTGFALQRVADEPKIELIHDHMRAAICGARFPAVYLSHANRRAYREAGYGEGLGKPVILTCEHAKFRAQSHLHTNHHLTVMWDTDDPGPATKFLKAAIRATIPDAKQADD